MAAASSFAAAAEANIETTVINETTITTSTSAAPRPTQLFSNNKDTTSSAAFLEMKQQSPISATSSPTTSIGKANISPSSSHSSSATTSPSFLPEMPQWKKDLIQRRKSNVARTIGATASAPTTTTATAVAAGLVTPTTTTTYDHHVAADDLHSPTTPTKANKFSNTTTTATSHGNREQQTDNEEEEALEIEKQLQKFSNNLKGKMPVEKTTTTTNTITSPISTSPTTTTITASFLKEKSEKFIGGHYTPPTKSKAAVAALVEERERFVEHNKKQTELEQQLKSAAATTTKYTPKSSPATTPQTSPTKTAKTELEAPIPKQRSMFLANVVTTPPLSLSSSLTTSLAAKSQQQQQHTKEQVVQDTIRAEAAESESEADNETAALSSCCWSAASEKRMAEISPTGSTGFEQVDVGEVISGSSEALHKQKADYTLPIYCERIHSTSIEKLAATTEASTTGKQLHSKYENEHTYCAQSNRTSAVNNLVSVVENNEQKQQCSVVAAVEVKINQQQQICANKISKTLQNNQFIKNQLQQHNNQQPKTTATTTTKYIKYRSQSVQETTSVAAAKNSSTLLTGSPTKFAANKKKMVAVQEMKNTTQNATHHHHHHHRNHHHAQQQHIIGATTCARQAAAQNQSENDEFDASEDLSYGPGIVSKLRCRYLSLALRESMKNERHHALDNMRRATSLNNLLDRDVHKSSQHAAEEEDEEEEDDAQIVEKQQSVLYRTPTTTTVAAMRSSAPAVAAYAQEAAQQQQNGCSLVSQKAATFQKLCATNGAANAALQMKLKAAAQNNNVNCTPRSRQVKRGNDSLKRARSVEALLCERTPWHFSKQTSVVSPVTSPSKSGVSIEDKIHNARERLISGTDSMPPKRLAPIIDDTERPPPDLVKQTMKLFEASANRRARSNNRNNGSGEVANKVATFKSIIKEQKPAIVYPKPTTPVGSPTKKLHKPSKPVAKPIIAAADLLGSPIGRKTIAACSNTTPTTTATTLLPLDIQHSTPKCAVAVAAAVMGLSEHSPDIIPAAARQLASNKKLLATEKHDLTAAIDSPVTALTKKLEKLQIQATTTSSITKETTIQGGVGDNNKQQLVGVAADAVCVTNSSSNDKNDDRANIADSQPDISLTETASTSSDLSEDEYGLTKRVAKTALDNIAKAGTTQQFIFTNNKQNMQKTSTPSAAVPPPIAPRGIHLSPKKQNADLPSSLLNVAATQGKQIGVIRPLLTTTTTLPNDCNINSNNSTNNQQQQNETSSSPQHEKREEHIKLLKQQQLPENTINSIHSSSNTTTQATAAATTFYSPPSYATLNSSTVTSSTTTTASHSLTTREIEKNRINEMKQFIAILDMNSASVDSSAAATKTSLDNVIKTTTTNNAAAAASRIIGAGASSSPLLMHNASGGLSELDASSQQQNSSPLWPLRKKRQTPVAAAENTSMVFNFSNRKEVPDYIENDGVIFRRKRELPKPNESGFVVLGDLSLETSTDSDYDDISMGPPSPCDVEFENANVVIDGKSSIRNKPKEATFRVQFNDTLTSTFEYPSEASLILNETFNEPYINHDDDLVNNFDNLTLDESDSPIYQHYNRHVAVADEIIPLPIQNDSANSPASPITPTTATSPTSSTNTPTKNILGNLPLGSAPLGNYTPTKAPIDNLFQLGVTRAPTATTTAAATTNGNAGKTNGVHSNGAAAAGANGDHASDCIDGLITNGIDNGGGDHDGEEPESLQFIKPGNDDLNIIYSEGAQKTDLLY